MNILHFYKTYITDSHGGVEQFIYQLIKGTQQYQINSEVLSLTTEKDLATPITFHGHIVHRAKLDFQLASTGFSYSAIKQFKRLAHHADVVHYHFPWPFMDMVHLLTGIKKPTIVTYHSDIVRQKNLLKLYKPLMHYFLNQVNHIVTTSPNYLESSDILRHYQHKTSVIPIGLARETYPQISDSYLKDWQKKLPPRFFLFIGILRYYKGLHTLLEALKGIDFPLVIAGTGPEELALKQQAEKNNLKNVYFIGKITEKEKVALLSLAYAFVFPSHLRSEAFGISLLEAAMFGKPLISCEIGTGTSYINQQNSTGLVVPPQDPVALKQALNYLWQDEERAKKMGVHAGERFECFFLADKMAADYSKLYHQLNQV